MCHGGRGTLWQMRGYRVTKGSIFRVDKSIQQRKRAPSLEIGSSFCLSTTLPLTHNRMWFVKEMFITKMYFASNTTLIRRSTSKNIQSGWHGNPLSEFVDGFTTPVNMDKREGIWEGSWGCRIKVYDRTLIERSQPYLHLREKIAFGEHSPYAVGARHRTYLHLIIWITQF